MPDLDLTIKALRLVWIPRLLPRRTKMIPRRFVMAKRNWKSVPDLFFRKLGGLKFFLRCNYDVNFGNIKSQYKRIEEQKIVIFNNREILIGGRPFFKKRMVFKRNNLNKIPFKGQRAISILQRI